MRYLLALCLVVVLGSVGHAQTVVAIGPVTTANRIAWDLPANLTLTDAPTFEVRLNVDGTPASALTNITWAPATGTVAAGGSAPLSQANVDALNRVGVHNITLSLFRADVGDSGPSLPFVLRAPAAAPTGVRITR